MFAVTQEVTELAKARTHLKEQLLIFIGFFLFVFLKSFLFSQFENLIL